MANIDSPGAPCSVIDIGEIGYDADAPQDLSKLTKDHLQISQR